MSCAAHLGLASNLGLLLMLITLLDISDPVERASGPPQRRIALGIAVGVICVLVLYTGHMFSPGVVLDARAVLLSISGLYLGAIPTLIGLAVGSAYRLYLGGAGTAAGLALLVAGAACGLLWRYARGGHARGTGLLELLGFGLVVHLTGLMALGSFLPGGIAIADFAEIAIFVYPPATVLIGLLITRRYQQGKAIRQTRESESRYRGLFERSHAAALIVNPVSRAIVDANEAASRFYGFSRDELRSSTLDLLNIGPADAVSRDIEAAMHGADVFCVQHRLADGRVRDVEVRSGPISISGRLLLYKMVFDVTERLATDRALRLAREDAEELLAEKRVVEIELQDLNHSLEQRVAQRTRELAAARDGAESANRLKNLFLATMSHELRTPLNAIIGFSDVLLHGLAGPMVEEQRRQIEVINRSGKNLLALISDLLDVSKIEAGHLALHIEPTSVPDLIAHEVEAARPRAAEKGLDIRIFAGKAPALVHADPMRVRQVVSNLLTNAIKYSDSGVVELAWCLTGEEVVVRISDMGIGIPEDHHSMIFKPFHRVACPRSKNREGTGLGLAICEGLVRKMGGEIGLFSNPAGGTTFWFSLPQATSVAPVSVVA